jgi:hypothetical protein
MKEVDDIRRIRRTLPTYNQNATAEPAASAVPVNCRLLAGTYGESAGTQQIEPMIIVLVIPNKQYDFRSFKREIVLKDCKYQSKLACASKDHDLCFPFSGHFIGFYRPPPLKAPVIHAWG